MCEISVTLSDVSLDPEMAHGAFRRRAAGCGAIVAFTGITREDDHGKSVAALTLQHYPGFTEKEINKIAAVAAKRWPLEHIEIVHCVGVLRPGDPIVFVAAASRHRRAAFSGADFLMDYLKSEAPLWKKETSGDTEKWIEPRAEDFIDKARWEKEG